MKKILLLLLITVSFSVQSQKKKTAVKSVAAAAKKTTLAKADNLLAEVVEKKNGSVFYTLAGKDTLFSKPVAKEGGSPTEVKITSFTANAAKLHAISWNQKKKVGDPKTKLENITESHTEIWDVTA